MIRPPLVVEPAAPVGPGRSVLDSAPRWVGGFLSGVQGALLSLVVVLVGAVVAYVATATDPTNADVAWLTSVGIGARLWLLGHAVPLETAAATVTLVPLGLTALAVFTGYASARRSGRATRSGLIAGVGGYVVVVLAVALLSGVTGPGPTLRAFAGGLLVGALGVGGGVLARPDGAALRAAVGRRGARLPGMLVVGTRAGAAAAALTVGLAALVVVGWLFEGRETMTTVLRGLDPDPVGGVVLGLGQALLAPNLVVWALAWLAGPGFVVGSGSLFTSAQVVAAPLPAVPVLGALPRPDMVSELSAWSPVVLVLVGLVVAWALERRHPAARPRDALAAVGVAALVSAVLVGALVFLGSGAAGPGRLAHVGASGLAVIGAMILFVGSGLALGTAAASAVVRRAIVRVVRRAVGRG